MQVVILGASSVGILLAKRLMDANDVILVDVNASYEADKAGLDIACVDGVIIDLSVLSEAGLNDCDVVCALSMNENLNLMASQIAKMNFNVKKVISSVFDNDEYRIFEELGVVPISQTELTVDQITREINDSFSGEKGLVEETECNLVGLGFKMKLFDVDKKFIGSRIKSMHETEGGFIFSILRDGQIIQAFPDMKIEEGDRLIACVVSE
ncbi:MAG TPA: NAD-binding protein [Saccharofermentans sp.]|nr:NAD-binding protein [Saccharofermentans sp.]